MERSVIKPNADFFNTGTGTGSVWRRIAMFERETVVFVRSSGDAIAGPAVIPGSAQPGTAGLGGLLPT